jgi:eukaryotic-like serine/threonine-protein kinase
MMNSTDQAQSVFLNALEISEGDRAAYIDAQCRGDQNLRREVEDLLRHAPRLGRFLEGGDSPVPIIDIPAAPGTQIGPYKLREQIGEGGFGVVYVAEQEKPVARKVALKIIKPGMDTRDVIARFEAERQALALMDHPNIAKVLDAGTTGGDPKSAPVRTQQPRDEKEIRSTKSPSQNPMADAASVRHDAGSVPHDESVSNIRNPDLEIASDFNFRDSNLTAGRPYFVMELVRGVPISDFCDDHKLATRERLQLFVDVCRAVQHAHQKGIIHRDLKPSNVMVTLHDDKPVVKVIDFGVSKALSTKLTEKTLYTAYGQMVGTPLYMSPEQAQLSGLDVDTRSDVYSLGVLLYELLTGTTPFDKETLQKSGFDEMRRIIREVDPPRPSARISTLRAVMLSTVCDKRHIDPRKLSQSLRGELDWIVMKALEKDRNRRYESASAFAADVERYLHDEPVHACPESVWYRFGKFARRKKTALTISFAAALAGVLALAGLATSSILIAREKHATQDALHAERDAVDGLEKSLDRERRDSYFHRIALAHRELSVNNLGGALQLLGECPELLRGWEWSYLQRLCRVEPVVLQDNTEVTSVAFSPRGERLVSAGADGSVKIWSCETSQVVLEIPEAHADSVVSVTFHPGGKHVASAGMDSKVKVWDLATGKAVFTESITVHNKFGTARSVSFSTDGRCLAAGRDGAVNVWDWTKRQLLDSFPGHGGLTISVAFSSDGRLASGSWRGGLTLWDVKRTGTPFPIPPGHRHPISALSFSPHGRRIASASFDRTIKVWDATTGKPIHTLRHPTGLVLGVAFSPDGSRIASAGEDKIVRVWDATTGREVLGLHGHRDVCGCVAFSPDGRRLASVSPDRTIRVWDATPLRENERQELETYALHADEIWSLAISPDGHSIVSAGFDNSVKVWDARTGRVSVDFRGHDKVVFCVAWHPTEPRIASAGWVGAGMFTVKVWNAQTGEEIFSLPPGPEYLSVAFSPDGRHLLTGRANGTVQVWDTRPGRQETPLGMLGSGGRVVIRGVVFSRDGKRFASAGDDGIVKLWDATRLDQKEPRHTFPARVPGPSLNIAFSPDGRRLAAAGQENTVMIWDADTGRQLETLRGHGREVYAVAFSPDGRWIASAGEDSTVKVWNSRTGDLVRSFRGHTGLVASVAFSPDGRRLYSGSRDTTVKVWDVSPLDRRPVEK